MNSFWLRSLLAASLVCGVAAAQELPRIAANDNRVAGGKLDSGVLRMHLEIREGLWFPEAEDGESVAVQAFAEVGRSLQIPGPMLRVPQGTQIVASVRNRLHEGTARLYGLHLHPAEKPAPIDIPAGETREVRFRADTPGTYYYWASTSGELMDKRFEADAHLSGALIVDGPGLPNDDRVFVIGEWARISDPNVPIQDRPYMFSVNGKAWPYSERLTHKVGETVRWRWINTTSAYHPMHLHGSFYRVDSVGDGNRDVHYAETERRAVVTEVMETGGTMSTTWNPVRPGRWLFHCHVLAHMSPNQGLFRGGKENHGHNGHGGPEDAAGMKGLVMGITVLPGAESVAATVASGPARQLKLLVRERPATWAAPRARVFQFQDGEVEPPVEEATVPGPALILKRGEPTEITVVNQLADATSVHWHGIELDSYYDGVPGWGGLSTQVTPPIAPGESFVAKMTPPRAGTFIYHTHWHDEQQISTGLYGALIVMEPGNPFDLQTDKIFVISRGGPDPIAPTLLNGAAQPLAMKLVAGVKYRFRFINITANAARLWVSLHDSRAGDTLSNWRAVAKDGADLPESQAVMKPANQRVAVGETYDFEFKHDEPGEMTLEIALPRVHTSLTQTLLFEEPRK